MAQTDPAPSTKSITYVGFADIRSVGPKDLLDAGAEVKSGIQFRKGEPKDVPQAVAEVLLNNPLFTGEFVESKSA